METQTRLSRHNKFISAKNIVSIFSISSDDSFTCSVLYIHIYVVHSISFRTFFVQAFRIVVDS